MGFRGGVVSVSCVMGEVLVKSVCNFWGKEKGAGWGHLASTRGSNWPDTWPNTVSNPCWSFAAGTGEHAHRR